MIVKLNMQLLRGVEVFLVLMGLSTALVQAVRSSTKEDGVKNELLSLILSIAIPLLILTFSLPENSYYRLLLTLAELGMFSSGILLTLPYFSPERTLIPFLIGGVILLIFLPLAYYLSPEEIEGAYGTVAGIALFFYLISILIFFYYLTLRQAWKGKKNKA